MSCMCGKTTGNIEDFTFTSGTSNTSSFCFCNHESKENKDYVNLTKLFKDIRSLLYSQIWWMGDAEKVDSILERIELAEKK